MRRCCIEGVRPAVLVGDRGIGAVPQAGVHHSGPMGSARFHDHQAEAAAAQGHGHSPPFGPPGFPQAYPAPGTGYGVAPAPAAR
jgi:hypothetical protein